MPTGDFQHPSVDDDNTTANSPTTVCKMIYGEFSKVTYLYFICLGSLTKDPVVLDVRVQNFYTVQVIALDL